MAVGNALQHSSSSDAKLQRQCVIAQCPLTYHSAARFVAICCSAVLLFCLLHFANQVSDVNRLPAHSQRHHIASAIDQFKQRAALVLRIYAESSQTTEAASKGVHPDINQSDQNETQIVGFACKKVPAPCANTNKTRFVPPRPCPVFADALHTQYATAGGGPNSNRNPVFS